MSLLLYVQIDEKKIAFSEITSLQYAKLTGMHER